MDEVLEKLIEYVLALSDALKNDGNANDRPMLSKHLAESAISAIKESYQWPDFFVIPYEGIIEIYFKSDSCLR